MTQQSALPRGRAESEEFFFIPDLCRVQTVFFLLLLTQLLVVALCLGLSDATLLHWELLGLLSLYAHAITLSFAACLCFSRRYLSDRSLVFSATFFLFTNQLITLTISSLSSLRFFPFMFENPALFIIKSCLISLIIACILLRYFYLQAQWKEQKQSELRSRIEALQARIRPHFLFNSMNSIASLISVDPIKAEDAVLDLCSLFRATLNTQQTLIPLQEELDLCRQYLNIVALRLGKRLQLDWQVKDLDPELKIPPLSLQPLFENAIYHGIQPRTEGGTITIRAEKNSNSLTILISNPYTDELSSHSGNRIALDNIRSRLQAILGDHAVLKTSKHNGLFTVTLRIPKYSGDHAKP